MEEKNNKNWGKILLIIGVGFAVGMVNGFFGGGGGMICVPLLMLCGLSNKKSHATAILTMLPISIASFFVYYSSGAINFIIFLFVAIGSVVGGILGALLLKKIPNIVLSYIFSVLMIVAGVRMCF